MKKNFFMIIRRLFPMLVLVSLLAACGLTAVAQTKPPSPNPSINASQMPGVDDQAPTDMELELRAKREIKSAEKEHQENVGRAKEASSIGKDLAAAFKQNKSLRQDDLKNLDKLEKLTKKIRSEAGASDDDVALDDKPKDLAGAVDCIAKVSTELSDRVQKTPRRVVSTAIIDQANVLLELIRIVRELAR